MMSYTCREEQNGLIIDEQIFECTSAADAATIYWGRRIQSNPEWQYQNHVISVSYESGSLSFGWTASPRSEDARNVAPEPIAPPRQSGWYAVEFSSFGARFTHVNVTLKNCLVHVAGISLEWGTDGFLYQTIAGEVNKLGSVLNYAGPYDPASFLSLEGIRK